MTSHDKRRSSQAAAQQLRGAGVGTAVPSKRHSAIIPLDKSVSGRRSDELERHVEQEDFNCSNGLLKTC